MAHKKGVELRPWTREELAELRRYSARRSPISVIARLMNRSEGALRQKARQLGIPIGERGILSKGASNGASNGADHF